ncbi:hypothetical protein [Pedobacter sp. MW01-1-1]|uniref:hypothetical protein n=1 Tax=Pedobacter sp. MW01-1-1 TaxID=3383027 RepID=UPI003FED7014
MIAFSNILGMCDVMGQTYSFDLYKDVFEFQLDSTARIKTATVAEKKEAINFYMAINAGNYQPLISSLKNYKEKKHLDDWIFYQLIRKTAEQISPKADNYFRYTLYKWFLLSKCGYDAKIAIGDEQIILYIKSDEDTWDIPFFMINNIRYSCLNYHDYGKLYKEHTKYIPVNIKIEGATNAFSYQVKEMPEFKPNSYNEKNLAFKYAQKVYHFKLKISNEVEGIFKNYPVVDYQTYFNIPLSSETYGSLIPVLKQNIKGMSQTKGIDYLMRFTRYAFLYEDDGQNFGKEKRLSPEQTLINEYSDCDDRAALFFYLVKEIYNLPMLAVLYPTHLTVAVQLANTPGEFILYNGKKYSFCEPTPQVQDLKIGQISANLKNSKYEVVYAYEPK